MCMSAEWVTAIATALLFAVTAILAFAAWKQLPMIAGQVRALAEQIRLSREAEANAERRQREWETVRACERYDVDPVLEAVTSRIHASSNKGTDYSTVEKRDLICLLNYFDGLAVGIEQGLYIEGIVRDHLGLIIDKLVQRFLIANLVEKQGYDNLLRLYDRWHPKPATPPTAYTSR